MRKIATLGAVAALGMSGAALAADGVSHSFLEAGYGYGELAGGIVDGDGFKVAGSLELPSNFVVGAGYRQFKYTDVGSEKFKELSAGVNYKWTLGSSFDVLAGTSFERLEVGGDGESGFGLNVGTRGRLTDKLELSANLQYVDIKTIPSTFLVTVGLRHYFTPAFAAGVDVRKSEMLVMAGETSFIATLRYDFGKLF
ncbi:MAG TPA: hypothetical protein VNQ32_16060 [Steroidobacteraceae bacterium]|nr:hypothetical protein [Steroidobacteraceae bacterium]